MDGHQPKVIKMKIKTEQVLNLISLYADYSNDDIVINNMAEEIEAIDIINFSYNNYSDSAFELAQLMYYETKKQLNNKKLQALYYGHNDNTVNLGLTRTISR